MTSAARQTLDAAMTEDQLFESVRAHLKAFGWLFWHQYDSRRTAHGWPDVFAVKGERAIAWELKTENGKLSEAQEIALDALAEAGIAVAVIRPSDLSSGRVERILAGGIT